MASDSHISVQMPSATGEIWIRSLLPQLLPPSAQLLLASSGQHHPTRKQDSLSAEIEHLPISLSTDALLNRSSLLGLSNVGSSYELKFSLISGRSSSSKCPKHVVILVPYDSVQAQSSSLGKK